MTSNGSTTTNNIEIDGGHLRVETTLNPSLGYAFVGSDVIKVSNGSILALVNDTSGVAITGTGIATSSGVGISVSLVSPGVYRATIDGTTGNISTAGSVSSASVSVTNDTSTGNLAVGETAPASGVYNINMTGASGNINTVGAISSGSLSTTGNISGTALTLTGDISAANICSTGFVSANSLTATAGITGQALTLNGPNANTNFTMQGNACIVGGALNGGCLAMDRDLTVGGAITASGVISNGASSMCSGRVEAANILTTAGTLRSTGSTQLYDNIAFICSATGDKYFYEGFTSSPGQFLQASAPDINGDVRMEWADSVTVVPVPNSSTDPGNLGEVAIGNFFYWYTGTQWVRIAGNSF